MPRTLVFEIGTEEMPASAAKSGVAQVLAKTVDLLSAYRLASDEKPVLVESYGTARRLVLIVRGLPVAQESGILEIKGPPKRIAFGPDGSPAPAASGFAKTQGVEVEDLEIREVDGGEYLYAVKRLSGQAAKDVLPDLLTALVRSLEFSKMMRWGDCRLKFIRPIRWLLALYGEEVVPLALESIKSGRQTWGHRFLAEGPHKVDRADDYLYVMKQVRVVIDAEDARIATVKRMIDAAAAEAKGRAAINPKVLEEVIYLAEEPHVVVGSFDAEFLKIPRAVVVTAMEAHQRYFPIEDTDGRLMSRFAVVHNGDPTFDDRIRHGHERVLRARLADAAFFFSEDTKTALASKVDALRGVVWQKKLGTVFEKVERARVLGAKIADLIGLSEKERAKLDRTLKLCKADLTTSMVIEFTELQGLIGREYALVDGEDEAVADGIAEHYQPRFAGDALPLSTIGRAAALTDKIDTIVGCFLVGMAPTGSADPYSLRRQAAGIIGILGATRWQIGILDLIRLAIDNYAKSEISAAEPKTVAAQVEDFIVARLKRALVDDGVEADSVDAVLSAGFDIVQQAAARARLIDRYRGKNELEDIKLAFTRCRNLAKADLGVNVSAALFEMDEEKRLYEECRRAKEEMEGIVAQGRLADGMALLASLRVHIDDFFDAVLVMAPDEAVRANRLKLLNLCLSVSLRIADFSKLP